VETILYAVTVATTWCEILLDQGEQAIPEFSRLVRGKPSSVLAASLDCVVPVQTVIDLQQRIFEIGDDSVWKCHMSRLRCVTDK